MYAYELVHPQVGILHWKSFVPMVRKECRTNDKLQGIPLYIWIVMCTGKKPNDSGKNNNLLGCGNKQEGQGRDLDQSMKESCGLGKEVVEDLRILLEGSPVMFKV